MVTETYRPLLNEIFLKVNNKKDKPGKIKILRQYESEGMRKLLKAAFDPNITWLLPTGTVPFIANDAPDGTQHTRLEQEATKLNNYVALRYEGKIYEGNPRLNKMKREMLFVQMLEGLTTGEAEILIAAKDKSLNKKYRGLNANTVREAFNWDENFKAQGVPVMA